LQLAWLCYRVPCRLFWTRPKKGRLERLPRSTINHRDEQGGSSNLCSNGSYGVRRCGQDIFNKRVTVNQVVDDWTPHGKSIGISWLVWKCHGNRFHGVDKPPFDSGALSFRSAADQVNLHRSLEMSRPSVFTSTSPEWTRKVAPSDIPVCQTLQEQRAPRRLVA
jgi:hypothetical protein